MVKKNNLYATSVKRLFIIHVHYELRFTDIHNNEHFKHIKQRRDLAKEAEEILIQQHKLNVWMD